MAEAGKSGNNRSTEGATSVRRWIGRVAETCAECPPSAGGSSHHVYAYDEGRLWEMGFYVSHDEG